MATPSVRADSPIIVLASFNGGNGNEPIGGLTLSGNTLYGTTQFGGASNFGTVFSIPVTGGVPTVLASFSINGRYPLAGVTLSDNTLYGTTSEGTNNDGTVFSVPVTGGGTPTVLASFNGSNGADPQAGVIRVGNALYGTTYAGGAYNYGAVFSVPITGGTPAVLGSFDDSNGSYPHTDLISSGGKLYGTTTNGGPSYGAVFSIPLSGGTPALLGSFNGYNGLLPRAGLTLVGNTLYGTTDGGVFNQGTVFSVPITGGTPTTLATFNGSNGESPYSSLIRVDDRLYGTTVYGGAYNSGTVFSIPITGGTPTTLASFDGSNGAYPESGLTVSGNALYGTTTQRGANNKGTVFAVQITSNVEGSLTNFNMVNNTGHYEDNFEIDLPGVSVSDINGFYKNPDYGFPTVTPSADGVLVTYANPTQPTAPGATEHFGVRTNTSSLTPAGAATMWWTPDGNPIETPTDTLYPLTDKNGFVTGAHDALSLTPTVVLPIWVQRSYHWIAGDIDINNLMPTDPIITGATPLDSSAQLLNPGAEIDYDSLLPGDLPPSVTTVTFVMVYSVFSYDATLGTSAPGSSVGTFYDAIVISVPEPSFMVPMAAGALAIGQRGLRKRRGERENER